MNEALQQLADRHGVATSYLDQRRQSVDVAEDTIIEVLKALGVDADETVDGADDGPPPVIVMRESMSVTVVGVEGPLELRLEDGTTRKLADPTLPIGLPLGWHVIKLSNSNEIPLCVAPDRLAKVSRGWGWMAQLYAMRSVGSWGIGDFGDLRKLVEWTAERDGDVVLINPLHAVDMTAPMQPSPYSPASRQWMNPIYLVVEDLPEYVAAPPDLQRNVDECKPLGCNDTELIDRDAVWAAKQQALQLLFDISDGDEVASKPLAEFALWCALAELHGEDWREWPRELHDPTSSEVASERDRLRDRIRWFCWLQQRCDEQCRSVQAAATAGGMSVGVMQDLAVGVSTGGADAWLMRDALALDVRIGAPPDGYNQQGQDWGMPPWHPKRLAGLAYQPLREMVASQLARGGGLRIDHVLGLFRLWWIPEGKTAAGGTYVTYDAEAMLSVIALEAHRAGAVIVGEDVGTVPDHVREALADLGVLGTSLLLFERVGQIEKAAEAGAEPGAFRPLDRWRPTAMASVASHDLPSVLGWLRGEGVKIRAERDLLDNADDDWARWRIERDELVTFLVESGLAQSDDDDTELVFAMHRALSASPSELVVGAPGDAVGDLRQPNLPGTTTQYPNWKLPVTDIDGRQLLLDELLADPRTTRLAATLADLGGESAPAER